MTLSRGFGGTPIGHEIPDTVSAGVQPFIMIVIPSPSLGGASNAMNFLFMTSMTLEAFSNTMNIPTMMVGIPLAWELRSSGILGQGLSTKKTPRQTDFTNIETIAGLPQGFQDLQWTHTQPSQLSLYVHQESVS